MTSIIKNKIQELNTIIEQATCDNVGLMTGLSGLAMYYYTLYEIFEEQQYAELAVEKMEQVFEKLNDTESNIPASFCSGLAGVGYASKILADKQLIEIDWAEDFAEIDEYLFNTALKQIIDEKFTDWMHGATGILKYFLSRTKETIIQSYCQKLANALLDVAVHEDGGTWIPNNFNRNAKQEEINFSLSHGQCGLLLVLCDYIEQFPDEDKVKSAVQSGINFLLSNERMIDEQTNNHSFFPFSRDPLNKEEKKYSQRLAWCYGDTNELMLLYRAGKLLNNEQWLQVATKVGHASVQRRNYETTLTEDSHFCHGSAGLAAVYKSLFLASGNEVYQTGHQYWADITLRQIEVDIAAKKFQQQEDSLIDGYAGVAAVLSSSFSNKKLPWEQIFLL